MPLVSIILPAFNEEPFIAGCLDSILAQTFRDFEVLLLDHASTDSTAAAAEPFLADERVRFFQVPEQLGGETMASAPVYRYLIDRAEGDLIAHMGADDLMVPDRLELQVEAFDADPELMVCHTGAQHISLDGSLLPGCFAAPSYHAWNQLRMALAWNWIALPTVMHRRELEERVGPFREVAGPVADYDMWLRAAGRVKHRYIDERLLYWRAEGNTSNDPAAMPLIKRFSCAVRREVRSLLMIEELFPEVLLCRDETAARAAALLEQGNLWLAGGVPDLESALREYAAAEALLPDRYEICFNAAVAALLLGHKDAALETLAALPDNPVVQRTRLLARGLVGGRYQLLSGHAICPELYSIEPPPQAWRSDRVGDNGRLQGKRSEPTRNAHSNA